MSIYDVNGNEILTDSTVTEAEVKDAFVSAVADGTINIGSQIGATLSYTGLTDAWITNARSAYTLLKAQYDLDPSRTIPFFISTDQHGSGLQPFRFMNNEDTEGMNFVSINLGDTVIDKYSDEAMLDFYNTIKQVKNFIGVVGNHDANPYGATKERLITRAFCTTNLTQYHTPSRLDSYTVIDGLHAVKYLVLDNYYLTNESTQTKGFDGETLDWMIDWLSRNDSMDIVILMHWPCCRTWKSRDDSEESAHSDVWTGGYDLWDFFLDRKNKQSGTIDDMDGVSHSYDFSGCKTELLCELSGHQHQEKFSVADGFTSYVANRQSNNNGLACVFGCINRTTQKLHIWEFSSNGVLSELVLDI